MKYSISIMLCLFTTNIHCCPTTCNCYETTEVDCSSRTLIAIPAEIPTSTVNLDLSYNQIAAINPGTFEGNYGCAGGWVEKAYLYAEEKGIDTEESYPYEANNGTCRFKPSGKGATVTGYINIEVGDENALKVSAATVGPISVGINAAGRSFQSYKTGIYNDPLCNSAIVDHAVLVVGYGIYNGEDYWLVKNSWGTDRGMNGYIMMSRNKGNQCWIASQALYPLV